MPSVPIRRHSLVGWILAKKGIVDDKAKKILNKLNVSLFTPALLFSKVAFSLTPDKLADLIIIPIGFVICTVFSAGVAFAIAKVFRLKKAQRNFAIACTMFQNSNSLPIALMQSLIGEKMPLRWGPHDTKDQMLGRALSYLVLFSTLGIIVRWSFGVRLLTSAETEQDELESVDEEDGEEIDDLDVSPDLDATSPLLDSDEYRSKHRRRTASGLLSSNGKHAGNKPSHLGNGIENGIEGAGAWAQSQAEGRGHGSRTSSGDSFEGDAGGSIKSKNGNGAAKNGILLVKEPEELPSSAPLKVDPNATPRPNKKRTADRIFMSFPNTPIPSQYGSEVDDEDREYSDDDEEDQEMREWGPRSPAPARGDRDGWFEGERAQAVRRTFAKVWRPIKRFGIKIGAFMTVPLWAALLSLVVACIPPLQWALNEAKPLKSAIRNAGNCSVPITLVTLGAYFYRPSAPTSPSDPKLTFWERLNPFRKLTAAERRERRRTSSPGETRTVLVAVLSRMIIVPALLIPIFGYYAAMTVNVADDPIFVVVACLLIGSPTAITLAQITSSASGETFEKLISRTLFVSYAIMTPPCTIALVLAALRIDQNQQ
ncbi:BZ3500_MvSof-1268-A1-R1_Chr3-1g05448 [Microbotryum saponariae]|uniref:BZ3500_MvSof-1268-A1-R1_Chr3-1g05448 protein n=1 Tax=Microbotryum saponariae TaxID=289078 RepID=A0A2X0LFM9_9BASI|nr:BZ3500_MvSof-1268-A1-R1_Chr3-1g05448 [Microbotryum saponariae]SDA04639.1 BZ3501_MvSof-1269-A2-R1_Chr3-1g05119 [Microbotryum saponariae]